MGDKVRVISCLLVVITLIGVGTYYQIPVSSTEDLRLKNILAVSELEDGEKGSDILAKEKIVTTKVLDVDIYLELQPDNSYKEVVKGYHILQVTSCEGEGLVKCYPDMDYDYWPVECSSSDFNGFAGKKRK